MNFKRIVVPVSCAALFLSACGGGDVGASASSAGTDSASQVTAPVGGSTGTSSAGEVAAPQAGNESPVTVAETSIGTVVTDSAGLTLYGFLKDTDGQSSCVDGCAAAWPPLLVSSAQLPAGLDAEKYSVINRADGTFQLKLGKWPLYYFAGDAVAGDTNGQGSDDVWFAAAPDGSLVGAMKNEAPNGGAVDEQKPAAPTAPKESPKTTKGKKGGY